MEEDLVNLSDKDWQEVCNTLGKLFLTTYVKILTMRAERGSSNTRLAHSLPPIFPYQFASLRPGEFFDIVKQRKERLFCTLNDGDLVELEYQFRLFKRHISGSSASQPEVKKYEGYLKTGGDVFGKAWSAFCNRFTHLAYISGGIASVLPGTRTVESDFSVIQWKRTHNARGRQT